MCVLKCLRPDKAVMCARNVVREVLGERMLQAPSVELGIHTSGPHPLFALAYLQFFSQSFFLLLLSLSLRRRVRGQQPHLAHNLHPVSRQ